MCGMCVGSCCSMHLSTCEVVHIDGVRQKQMLSHKFVCACNGTYTGAGAVCDGDEGGFANSPGAAAADERVFFSCCCFC